MFSTRGYAKLTKEVILARVSPIEIFHYYIPLFDGTNKSFTSDLYADKNPSCRVKKLQCGGALYKDFGTGDSYDCFSYVQAKYNCSFIESLKIIDSDFNLGIENNRTIAPSPLLVGHISRPKLDPVLTKIQIKARSWNTETDKKYWGKYYLTCATLNKYKVIPCSHIWINGTSYTASPKNPFYAFRFARGIYKILSPFAGKRNKWRNNATQRHLQGYLQLPSKGDLLIITKSLKDVMVLDTLGYSAVAPQSELVKLSESLVEELKDRFKHTVVLYDNDTTGIEGRNRLVSSHGFSYIEIPGDTKDVSDFIKLKGKENTTKLLKELLNDIKKF